MKSIFKKSIPNQETTEKLAQKFYDEYLKNETNATIFFEGGLGVGKTLIIRTILRQAGIKKEIPSPTYTFVQEYDTPQQHFAHFDFYRFQDPQDFFTHGFDEIAESKNTIKFVEWPEKITPQIQKGFIGKKYIIQIKHGIGVGMREIKVLEE